MDELVFSRIIQILDDNVYCTSQSTILTRKLEMFTFIGLLWWSQGHWSLSSRCINCSKRLTKTSSTSSTHDLRAFNLPIFSTMHEFNIHQWVEHSPFQCCTQGKECNASSITWFPKLELWIWLTEICST